MFRRFKKSKKLKKEKALDPIESESKNQIILKIPKESNK